MKKLLPLNLKLMGFIAICFINISYSQKNFRPKISHKSCLTKNELLKKEATETFFNNYHEKHNFMFESKFKITINEFIEFNPYYFSIIKTKIATTVSEKATENEIFEKFVSLIDQYQDYCIFNEKEIIKGDIKYLSKNCYVSLSESNSKKADICDNLDFSQNYTNWDTFCTYRTLAVGGYQLPLTQYTPSTGATCNGYTQHTFFTGGNDPFIAVLPTIRPGGNGKSMMIGDGGLSGGNVSALTRTFTVTAAQPFLRYYYAAVLEDPGHLPAEQPFFATKIQDASGNTINCTEFNSYAGDGSVGWLSSGTYQYRNWTEVFVPLQAYIGQTITFQMITGDCDLSGHFGYAYVEFATCSPDNNSIQVDCTTNPTTLVAPNGVSSYLWNTGATTQTINPTSPGTYTVTIVPLGMNAACGYTYSIDYNEIDGTLTGDATVCQNDTSPTLTFTGAQGVPPYTFNYTINGGTTQSVTSTGNSVTINAPTNTAGTFTYQLVNIQDSSSTNCLKSTSNQSAVVIVNPLPTATIQGTTDVCLNSSSPSITFTGGTGTAPYTFSYTINGGSIQTITSSGNTATIAVPTSSIGTFTYELINIQDSSSTICTQSITNQTATVTVHPIPTAIIQGNTTVCQNSPSPTITITGAQGTAPYTFNYTLNGGSSQTVVSSGNSATITVPTTTVGTFVYSLTSVQDASAATCSQNITNQNVQITVLPLPTATITGDNTICLNGTPSDITFTGSSGTAPYTFSYTINGGNIQTISSTSNTVNITPPTNTIGTYVYELVSVQDSSSNNCTQNITNQTATIIINSLPTGTINGSTTVCQNDNAPIITFTGSNGVSPYTFNYTINGGTTQSITSNTNTITITAPTNSSGSYIYELIGVTDASSTACNQNITNQIVTININPLPAATAHGDIIVCLNDPAPNVTFTGNQGTPPYTFTYTINGGTSQTVTSNGNIATVSVPTNTPGTFTYEIINVTDSSNTQCSQNITNESATVTVNLLPLATIQGNNTLCVNDNPTLITFTGTQGTPPYTFTYTINGGAPQTIQSTSNTATINPSTTTAGTFVYQLIGVVDSSSTNCSNSFTEEYVTIIINPLPSAIIQGDITLCQNDNEPLITFTGSQGTAPYTFTYTINGGTSQTVTSTGTTATITAPTNVSGNFTYNLISVQDASSTACSQNITNQNAVVIINPLPNATIQGDTSVCQNAISPVITFTGSQGTAPYTFTYSINGGTPQTVTSTGAIATLNVPTNIPGTYSYQLINVEDSSSTTCLQSINNQTSTIIINPLPTATIVGNTTVCQNSNEPIITFTGLNGTAPYNFSYQINNGTIQNISSNGNSVSINVPTTTTGTFTYNLISITDSSTTSCQQNIANQNAIIVVNPLPLAMIQGSTTVCQNDSNPIITFTGSQATAPYIFSYTINGGNTQTITSNGNLATINVPTNTPGTYVYEITNISDSSGQNCAQAVSNQTATINVNPLPDATIQGTTNVCLNSPTPTITFTGSIGTPPYTFSYTINGGSTQTITSTGNTATLNVPTTNAGTFVYELIGVEDASNTSCFKTIINQTATIIVNPLPDGIIQGTITVCQNDNSPLITFTGSQSTAPYIFQYTINGGNIQTITSTGNSVSIQAPTDTAGIFTYELINIQDSSTTNCSQNISNQTVVITINPQPDATISGTTTVCENDTNPVLTFTGSLGTAPYTFTYRINGGPLLTVTSTGNTATVSAPTNVPGNFIYQLVGVQDSSNTTCYKNISSQNAVITVNPLPIVNLEDGVICINTSGVVITPFLIETGFNSTNFSFQWFLNGTLLAETNNNYLAQQAGQYSVLVTNNLTGCTSVISYSNVTQIVIANDLTVIQDEYFTGNTSISVNVIGGTGVYQYQLDDNPFQYSNIFHNLEPGLHTIYVVDDEGCTSLTKEFFIVVYPNFFTPNNDGYNDTWNITGLSHQPDSKINIFDRYGKFIKQLSPSGIGWDGTHNGYQLPSTDYWFTVEYISPVTNSNAIFKSHFSMKR